MQIEAHSLDNYDVAAETSIHFFSQVAALRNKAITQSSEERREGDEQEVISAARDEMWSKMKANIAEMTAAKKVGARRGEAILRGGLLGDFCNGTVNMRDVIHVLTVFCEGQEGSQVYVQRSFLVVSLEVRLSPQGPLSLWRLDAKTSTTYENT